MYLPLCKLADTPLHIQGDDMTITNQALRVKTATFDCIANLPLFRVYILFSSERLLILQKPFLLIHQHTRHWCPLRSHLLVGLVRLATFIFNR